MSLLVRDVCLFVGCLVPLAVSQPADAPTRAPSLRPHHFFFFSRHHSPLSDGPLRTEGSSFQDSPSLPPLSLLSIIPSSLSLGVPVNAPGATDASQHQLPALVPLPGPNKASLMAGEKKSFFSPPLTPAMGTWEPSLGQAHLEGKGWDGGGGAEICRARCCWAGGEAWRSHSRKSCQLVLPQVLLHKEFLLFGNLRGQHLQSTPSHTHTPSCTLIHLESGRIT